MNKFKIFLITIVLGILSYGQSPPSMNKTAILPIVDMKLKGLLGGVKDGKWILASDTAKSMQKDQEFSLVELIGSGKPSVLSGTVFEPEVPCEEFYRMEFGKDFNSGVAVGAGANWNLQPRIPQKLENDSKIYKQVVKKFLAKKGLSNSTIQITQAYKIDLDGDGKDEVVIAATHYKQNGTPSAAAGDYSFVMVRKIIGSKVEEILVDGDFHKKGVEFGAPNVYEVSAIADLNGDGKLEIVVYGEYYEGAFSNVYELNGKTATSVLGSGCGV
jgi:hypothetical protein